MTDVATILGRFRSIHADVSVFRASDGSIGATLRDCEIKLGPILSGATEYGETVEDAIIGLWLKVESLDTHQRLVRNAMGPGRSSYRWDGFSWVLIDEAPQ